MNVPSTVSKLTISATPNNQYASFSVSNNKLKAGNETAVSIIVTAQDGTQKTYVIKATREMDENYTPSNNNYLKTLTPSIGTMYPSFKMCIRDRYRGIAKR